MEDKLETLLNRALIEQEELQDQMDRATKILEDILLDFDLFENTLKKNNIWNTEIKNAIEKAVRILKGTE